MPGLTDRLDRLSPAKRALLEQLLRKTEGPEPVAESASHDEIPRRPPGAPPALSFAQERMWFLEQWDAGNAFYHLAEGLRLRGRLDREALRGAIETLGLRHAALRTCIETTTDGPRPRLKASLPAPWAERDFAGHDEPESEARRWIETRAGEPFDLAAGPLWRLGLARLGEEHHLLSVTLHHAAADGWSLGILLRELTALYAAALRGRSARLPDLPIDYGDFAAWQKENLESAAQRRQIETWVRGLKGLDPLFELPVAKARPARLTHRGEAVSLSLDGRTGAAVRGLARARGATPFMVMIAAWAAVLGRWSRRGDFVIGTPVANRNRASTQGLVGCFVNMLPLRMRPRAGSLSFEDWVSEVKALSLDAFEAQDTPFETLVDALGLERTSSHAPLFQVIFALQNAPASSVETPGLSAEPVAFDLGRSGFDLSLIFEPEGDGYGGELRFNPAIYRRDDMERLATSYRVLLEIALAEPERDLGRLPLLDRASLARELEERRPKLADPLPHVSLLSRFEALAAQEPGRVAVRVPASESGDAEVLTYLELDEQVGEAVGAGVEI
ncbi:MAG: condensation domain-containing protein, partial [Acidobacteriota bacterium]